MQNSRREFIKDISMLASSSAILSMPWLNVFANSSVGKSKNNSVGLGIIGVGDRGKLLLENIKVFAESANVKILAVCDNYQPNYERAIKLTDNKAKSYYDYQKLLEQKDIDAVIVATPLHEHAHIVVDAFKAGKHVFCEKSMARTLDDIKLMYDTHKAENKILQIGHQRLFSPTYLNAVERIHKGELGQITLMRAYWHRNNNWRREVPKDKPHLERKINWRHYLEYSGGLFTELMAHQLQVANWIKKEIPLSVISNGSIVYWKDGREVYDSIACVFDYSDGSNFIYDSNISNKHYGYEEQIMGNKGTMELEVNQIYSEETPKPPAIIQLLNDVEKNVFNSVPIGGASWAPETASKFNGKKIYKDDKLEEAKLQLEAFVKYVREGKAPEELTIQGYYASIWSLLAEQSAKSKQRVTMPEKYRI